MTYIRVDDAMDKTLERCMNCRERLSQSDRGNYEKPAHIRGTVIHSMNRVVREFIPQGQVGIVP